MDIQKSFLQCGIVCRQAVFVARRSKQKTRHSGRVFVETHETSATAYPARKQIPGRRAREVMPAAMRALVRFAGEGLK
jgi:hypothetical protein